MPTDDKDTKLVQDAEQPGSSALSSGALEKLFRNESLKDSEREHAFCEYWHRRADEEGLVSHTDLVALLDFLQWPYAIGDIIERFCSKDRLRPEDTGWLLTALPTNTFAHEQVLALTILRDSDLDWKTKLSRVLALRAGWATVKIVSQIPLEELDTARQVIEASKKPARTRNGLLRILNNRVKSG